ncbi:glycosyltransferase [Streptomyces abikoensis]|uniref:glycosyltransferase n=1 Tax=Streptomyces abikoensis TaxID=97398 RepID=UPI003722A11C
MSTPHAAATPPGEDDARVPLPVLPGTGPTPAGTAHDLELVIPAYNEERRLAPTVLALADHLRVMPVSASLRVVDNGSSDRTAECVDRLAASGIPITVTGCSRRGKGAAVARGMVTTKARWVGFCDADLATPATAIDDAVALLRQGRQVVIGSRRCTGASVPVRQPALRRLGGAGFRLATRRFSGPVKDTQCGFKFFEADAARRIFADVTTTGFAFDLEVIARARALGLSLAEFPVVWSDQEGSSFRPFADGRRVAGELWRLHRTMHRLPPRVVHHAPATPATEGAG